MRIPFAALFMLVAGSAGADEPSQAVQMARFQVPAEQFEIGVHRFFNKEGVLYLRSMEIISVTKGSVAERAGLKRGMRIISIYGVKAENRIEREFAAECLSQHTPDRVTVVVARFIGGLRTIEIVWPKKKAAYRQSQAPSGAQDIAPVVSGLPDRSGPRKTARTHEAHLCARRIMRTLHPPAHTYGTVIYLT